MDMIGTQRPQLVLEEMRDSDVSTVLRVEDAAFSTTWPDNAFRHELEENRLAHYFVARHEGEVVGFGGIWVIMEDAHITTIAVHPAFQRRKFGEALLLTLLLQAILRQAAWITLEVRVSNTGAQRLYHKYGFTTVAIRRGYYTDNREDAFVMWAGDLRGDLYRARLESLSERLQEHLAF
jgi:[ribosomal protein S18]-alanine N-acetyltransferase